MPTKYKVILTALVIIVGFVAIIFENPDLSRVAFLYDYYLLQIKNIIFNRAFNMMMRKPY